MGLKERETRTPSVRWIKALEGMNPSTAGSYRREVNGFLEWAGETPDSLVKYWVEIVADPTQNMGLSDNLNDYLSDLDERGYSGGKQTSTVKALKKFFKVNGFNPTLDVKSRVTGEGARSAKRVEIKTILDYGITSPKTAALVAITKDSALRVSDIVRIQYKHIKDLFPDPDAKDEAKEEKRAKDCQWICFKIDIKKTRRKKRKGLPCLGVDAVKHLRKWLVERDKLGLTSNPDDFVFVNSRDMDGYEVKGQARSASVRGSPMHHTNAGIAISKLCKRAGYDDLSANSFRKFNTTALTMSGMGEDRIRLMQGKSQRSSVDEYLDAEAGKMLEVYKGHYSSLAVDEMSSDAEVIQEIREQHEGTLSELDSLKARLDNYDTVFERIRGKSSLFADILELEIDPEAHWERKKKEWDEES